MKESTRSYRQIMKATSLFGGVQFISILIAIIKSKAIAVLLGPAGIGIVGLLTSATAIISALTNFGLGVSAVKEVATAKVNEDQERISLITSVLNKLTWLTGILGTLITLLLSSFLSWITFGNYDYTLSFALISISLLFIQLTAGKQALIQGMHFLKSLARANLFTALSGIVISLPFFYFFRYHGIVPSIIASSVCSLFFFWFYSKNLPVKKYSLTFKEAFVEGKQMITMGFVISINGILVVLVSYVIRSYIANKSGVEEVGLFNAGFTIVNTYVGMIFLAMQTDYYPRLSTVSNSNEIIASVVNKQAEIATLILSPILVTLIVLIKWGLIFLYSNQFTPVETMIQWASIGIFFKTASWALAFVFISKGKTKLFIINEFLANFYTLVLNIIGYNLFGLDGLGISFTISYMIYFLQVAIVLNTLFKIKLLIEFWQLFLSQFILAIIAFIFIAQIKMPISLLLGFLLMFISFLLSLFGLRERLDWQWLYFNKRK